MTGPIPRCALGGNVLAARAPTVIGRSGQHFVGKARVPADSHVSIAGPLGRICSGLFFSSEFVTCLDLFAS
jgi:hypothetical protein